MVLGPRTPLSVHLPLLQVAKLDVDKSSAPDFFSGRGTSGQGGGEGGGNTYDSYDTFLASYAEAVEEEVGRLNGLLQGGGSS